MATATLNQDTSAHAQQAAHLLQALFDNGDLDSITNQIHTEAAWTVQCLLDQAVATGATSHQGGQYTRQARSVMRMLLDAGAFDQITGDMQHAPAIVGGLLDWGAPRGPLVNRDDSLKMWRWIATGAILGTGCAYQDRASNCRSCQENACC